MSDFTTGPRQNVSVGRAVAQHWIVATLTAVLVAAAVVGASQLLVPTTYTATTELLVNPLAGNPLAPTQRGDQLTTMPTEVLLVTSDSVAQQLTSEGSTIASGKGWRSKVQVQNPPNTAVIDVSYTADTAEQAARGADAIAAAYLATRTNRAKTATDATLASLQGSRTTASNALTTAADQLATAETGTSEYTVLVERVSGLSGQIAALDQQISDVKSGAGDPGAVLSPATPPSRPDGPSPLVVLAVALLLGCAAGVGVAVWRTRADDVIRDAEDVQQFGRRVVALAGGTGPQELARPLRAEDRRAIDDLLADSGHGTVQYVVASIDDDALHTLTTVAALGQQLGVHGHDVLVIDETPETSTTGTGRVLGRWSGGVWRSGGSKADGPVAPQAILIAGRSPLTKAGIEAARGRQGSLLVVEPNRTRGRSVAKALAALREVQDFTSTPPTFIVSTRLRSGTSRRRKRSVAQTSGV